MTFSPDQFLVDFQTPNQKCIKGKNPLQQLFLQVANPLIHCRISQQFHLYYLTYTHLVSQRSFLIL